MSRNIRRPAYRNRLSMATLSVAILLCVTLAGAFIAFVVSRNRLAALADEQRRVEQQIALYHQEIQALTKRIDISLTRDKVHERLTASGSYLKPVEQASIITLRPLEPAVSAPEDALHLDNATLAQSASRQDTQR